MKNPALTLPRKLPRVSFGRPSNRAVILIGLAAYAIVSWIILNSPDTPPVRFRLDPVRLVEASAVLKLHVTGALSAFSIGAALGHTAYPATAMTADDCVVLAWPNRLWAEFTARHDGFATETYKV
ncbi:MAG: hypothetical protein JKY78_04750, partial [Hyphomonas sp.]|nr:hypothetical protein [Hyphomonas sp.]